MTQQPQKKVLYLITKSNWGGAQRYVYDLASTLDYRQFEPVVALGGNGALVTMLHNADIHTISLSGMKNTTSRKDLWQSYRELVRLLRDERPDILHVNSSIAGLVGTLAGRTTRVPQIIFTAHGWAFNEDRPFWQRLAIKSLHYLTVLLSHRTIAVSRAIVTQMNWPGAIKRMKVINPGRNIGVMYERDAARAKIIDICPNLVSFQQDPWLVCIAELHPIKRHLILLEAFAIVIKKHPLHRLVIIGEGSERSVIEQYISKHNLSDNVFLTGSVIEAARFLKAFDLFVLASKSESYGYVLVEAGLAGIPVIATAVGGITDIIENKKTGLLIKPDSVAELTTALTTMLTDDVTRTRYAEALYQKLRPRTVAKMTAETVSLYLA